MVLNATFNNISAISWQSVLLAEETRAPRENHRPVPSHWQLYHKMLYQFIIETVACTYIDKGNITAGKICLLSIFLYLQIGKIINYSWFSWTSLLPNLLGIIDKPLITSLVFLYKLFYYMELQTTIGLPPLLSCTKKVFYVEL